MIQWSALIYIFWHNLTLMCKCFLFNHMTVHSTDSAYMLPVLRCAPYIFKRTLLWCIIISLCVLISVVHRIILFFIWNNPTMVYYFWGHRCPCCRKCTSDLGTYKSTGVKTSAKTSTCSPPLVSSAINGFLGYFYKCVVMVINHPRAMSLLLWFFPVAISILGVLNKKYFLANLCSSPGEVW